MNPKLQIISFESTKTWISNSYLIGQSFYGYLVNRKRRVTYNLVCLCPINVITVDPIGPKFCLGPYMTSGKVYAGLELLRVFDFREKKIINQQKKILYLRENAERIKIEIENWREAPKSPKL